MARSARLILSIVMSLAASSPAFTQTSLLAFGDSITAGLRDQGVSCSDPETFAGYPPRLATLLAAGGIDVQIQIAGVCGESSGEGVTRLDNVLSTIPVMSSTRGIVILMAGTNDFESNVGSETVLFNLRAMARKVEGVNAVPVYSSVIPRITTGGSAENILESDLAQSLRTVANAENIPFADPFAAFDSIVDVFSTHYADRLHPNEDGYDLLASTFEPPTLRALDVLRGLRNGTGSFCTNDGPCQGGEGDCDGDGECQAGLVCTDDVGAQFGFDPRIDVCLLPDGSVGDGDGNGDGNGCSAVLGRGTFCTECGPCAAGEGDCDSDAECQAGLACTDNVGAQFGFNPNIDVCLAPGGGDGGDGDGGDGGGDDRSDCTSTLGSGAFCTTCGPCAEGEGDCDSDNECQSGLQCTDNVGAQFGFHPNIDVCLAPGGGDGGGSGCALTNGRGAFCTECGPCAEGEGDCDSDSECQSGLTCTDDVGAQFGFAPNVDVCLQSGDGGEGGCTLTNGRGAFCTECGPCADGEGDCDSDSECQDGLICVDNVGAQFGFGVNVDVCLAPPA